MTPQKSPKPSPLTGHNFLPNKAKLCAQQGKLVPVVQLEDIALVEVVLGFLGLEIVVFPRSLLAAGDGTTSCTFVKEVLEGC